VARPLKHELTTRKLATLKLRVEAGADQRWARGAESLWDVEAELLLELPALLTNNTRTFLAAVNDDERVADVVANLAAMALDELYARAAAEGGDDAA
jgi:hypothetical protein